MPDATMLGDSRARRIATHRQVDRVVTAGRIQLSRKYDSEKVDGRWALGKEKTLKRLSTSTLIDDSDARPTAIQAHCRTSVCRIDAEFVSPRAADDWFALYTMNVGNEMPNVSLHRTTNPDGSIHLQLYGLARK